MTMLLGLVQVNMGPLSRPQALAEAARAAEEAGLTPPARAIEAGVAAVAGLSALMPRRP